MLRVTSRLTYANVVATIALFLALGGGAVWAAGKIQSSDLAANAVQTRNLAPHAVTAEKLSGTLPGLRVAGLKVVARAISIALPPPSGFESAPPPQLSFLPSANKTYLVEEEIRGDVTDANGPGGGSCRPSVELWVNGKFLTKAALVADADLPPQLNTNVASSVAPVGLTAANGQRQTITVHLLSDPGCGSDSHINQIRVEVVELG